MSGAKLRYVLGGAVLGALIGGAYAYMLSNKVNPLAVFNSPVTSTEPEWAHVTEDSPSD